MNTRAEYIEKWDMLTKAEREREVAMLTKIRRNGQVADLEFFLNEDINYFYFFQKYIIY